MHVRSRRMDIGFQRTPLSEQAMTLSISILAIICCHGNDVEQGVTCGASASPPRITARTLRN